MLLKTYLTFFSLFLFVGAFAQQNFENQFSAFVNNPKYKNATIGAVVYDLGSKEELLSSNKNRSMVPGSLLKLATSGAALEILGPDYKFQTPIYYTGKITPDSTLQGNLIIQGGGDPTLGSKYFPADFLKNWSKAISSKGIKRIEGNILMDISKYETQTVPDKWTWEDLGNYYGAGAGAFAVFDNTIKITFQSGANGKPTKIIKVNPSVEGLDFNNQVLASKNNSDQAYVYGAPWNGKRIIRGTIPRNRKEFTIKASLPNPELVLGKVFKQSLIDLGIRVNGEVKIGTISGNNHELLHKNESRPLGEIIKVLNHESVNLFAEHLVKQIAKEKNGSGNLNEGLKIIKGYWEKKGINTQGMFLEDGSGLSHFNAVTPLQISSILNNMYADNQLSEYYINSLATAGKGTLYVFSENDFPGNTLHCKSGSMSRVRCYAGYLKSNSNKDISFVFMANNFEGRHLEIIKEIEKLLVTLKQTI